MYTAMGANAWSWKKNLIDLLIHPGDVIRVDVMLYGCGVLGLFGKHLGSTALHAR